VRGISCGLLLQRGLFACLSVCWSQACAVLKRLNQSRCCLGCGLTGAQGTILGVGPELSTEGAHLGEGYTWVWPGSSAVSIINLACKVDAATGYRSRMQARI